MKIVILTTLPNSKVSKLLKEAGKKRGHEVECMDLNQMYVYISNVHRKDRLYLGEKRIYKKDIDAVISRIGASKHGRAIINHMHQNMGIFTTQTVAGIDKAADKLKTTQLLSLNGIKTPRTVYAKESKNPKFLIDLVGGLPVIVKGFTGSQGANVVILETVLSANSVLESYYKNKQQVLIQEYIEPDDSGAKDIRASVIGGKVITAMQRKAPKGSFKSNVSLGATAEAVKLTEDQEAICIKAAEAVGLDTSGVDLMTDKDGVNYIIEVNSTPGNAIQSVVKEDIAEAYIIHCEENYDKPDTRDLIKPLDIETRSQRKIHSQAESELLDIKLGIDTHERRIFSFETWSSGDEPESMQDYFGRIISIHGKEKVKRAVEFHNK